MPDLDVLGVGEAMVQLGPAGGRALEQARSLEMSIGGAEANVVVALARRGHRTAWASVVGDDPFGRRIVHEVGTAGVDVGLVELGPGRTGVYFKDPHVDGSAVYYYRAGSAASRADAALARRWSAGVTTRIVHVSGITPLLSRDAASLVDAIVRERCFGDAIVSFDVNLRAQLAGGDAADVLRGLALASDIVFVGLDEAHRLWDAATADEVRELLGAPGTLVVKDGSREAVSFDADRRTAVPAPSVEVVEPTGAGDAFAAGWLSAFLDGEPPEARLARGHESAGEALRTRADIPGLVAAEER